MTTEHITPSPETASLVLDSPECGDVAQFHTYATIAGCEKNDQVVAFPRLQRQAIDWMELNHRRHTMHGLIEVDETMRAARSSSIGFELERHCRSPPT